MRRLALCLLLCASLLGGCRVTYDVERRGPATEELSSERIEGLRLTPAVRDHGLELRVERLFSRTYTVTTDVSRLQENGIPSRSPLITTCQASAPGLPLQ